MRVIVFTRFNRLSGESVHYLAKYRATRSDVIPTIYDNLGARTKPDPDSAPFWPRRRDIAHTRAELGPVIDPKGRTITILIRSRARSRSVRSIEAHRATDSMTATRRRLRASSDPR